MSTLSPTPSASKRSLATFLVVAAHAFLWFAWLLGLLLWVPRVERLLHKMNLKLPSATELVTVLTHGIVPLGVLLAIVFVLLDMAVYYRIRRPIARTLWSGLMTVMPVVAILFSAMALIQPMVLVLEAISR